MTCWYSSGRDWKSVVNSGIAPTFSLKNCDSQNEGDEASLRGAQELTQRPSLMLTSKERSQLHGQVVVMHHEHYMPFQHILLKTVSPVREEEHKEILDPLFQKWATFTTTNPGEKRLQSALAFDGGKCAETLQGLARKGIKKCSRSLVLELISQPGHVLPAEDFRRIAHREAMSFGLAGLCSLIDPIELDDEMLNLMGLSKRDA